MIYTYSRDAVESGLKLTEPYALISISTPAVYGAQKGRYANVAQDFNMDDHAAMLPADSQRMDILRLAFWDVDTLDPTWGDRVLAQARLYSPEDARRVAHFVKGWASNIVVETPAGAAQQQPINLVVHCDAGISRSQGMADAIADHLDVVVKHSTHGHPNRHVYRLTREALRPGLAPLAAADPWTPFLRGPVIKFEAGAADRQLAGLRDTENPR